MKSLPRTAVSASVVAVALAVLLWPRGTDRARVSARTPSYEVTMTVDGSTTLQFDVVDRLSRRPVDTEPILVTLVMPQMGHTLPPLAAGRSAPGHYRVTRLDIPMAGQWEVSISFPNADVAVLAISVR